MELVCNLFKRLTGLRQDYGRACTLSETSTAGDAHSQSISAMLTGNTRTHARTQTQTQTQTQTSLAITGCASAPTTLGLPTLESLKLPRPFKLEI